MTSALLLVAATLVGGSSPRVTIRTRCARQVTEAEQVQRCAETGGRVAVQFAEYQHAARETSQLRLGGPQSVVAPMLGLASEAGSILNVYKRS